MGVDLERLFVDILRLFQREKLLKGVRMFVEHPENRIIIEPFLDGRLDDSDGSCVDGTPRSKVVDAPTPRKRGRPRKKEKTDSNAITIVEDKKPELAELRGVASGTSVFHEEARTEELDAVADGKRRCRVNVSSYKEDEDDYDSPTNEAKTEYVSYGRDSRRRLERTSCGTQIRKSVGVRDRVDVLVTSRDSAFHDDNDGSGDDDDGDDNCHDDYARDDDGVDSSKDRSNSDASLPLVKIKAEPLWNDQSEEFMEQRRRAMANKTPPKLEDVIVVETEEPDPKPHKCSLCTFSSKRPARVRLHMNIHTGERPYKCRHCDLSFKCNSMRIKHLRVHRDATPCQLCSLPVKNMSDHVRRAHKKYRCGRCSKIFSKRDQLSRHRVETGYKCGGGVEKRD